MIKITLPDGNIKEFESGSTPMDVAMSISEGLARNVISAKFNNNTVEVTTPLTTDGDLTLFTFNDAEGKKLSGTQPLTLWPRHWSNYIQV